MFSSDLEESRLQELFGNLGGNDGRDGGGDDPSARRRTPLAIINSGADEYVPPTVDQRRLLDRIMQQCPSLEVAHILPGANHAVNDSAEHMQDLCREVVGFFSRHL